MIRARLGSIGVGAAIAVATLGPWCLQAAAEPPAPAQVRKEARADAQALQENPTFGETLEIVVKFKDDGKVKSIVDAFWSDPEAAKGRFEVFKQGRPEMEAATLLRVTYSRELVLAFPCKTATKVQRETEARIVAAKLMASPDIAYAEPNLSFPTPG